MKHTPIRTQEHANKVGQLVGWAYEILMKDDAPIDGASVLKTMQSHPAYDEVFKGMIVYPNEEKGGISMFSQEEVLKGITLN